MATASRFLRKRIVGNLLLHSSVTSCIVVPPCPGEPAPWLFRFQPTTSRSLMRAGLQIDLGSEAVSDRKLEAHIAARRAVLVRPLAPKGLGAHQYIFCRRVEKIDRTVLTFTKRVRILKIGVVDLRQTVADRA